VGPSQERIRVSCAYDRAGQRIKKHMRSDRTVGGPGDPPPDPHYALERYVRDGMRLVGTFDGDGTLLWW
jgi:hypothetical protein